MNPVIIGDAILYNADCRDVLPNLQKVDCILTDPPYGMSYKSGYATDALWSGDSINGDETTIIRDYVLNWGGVLPILCFGTWKVDRPKHTKIVLIWDKGGALGMGDLSIPWKCDHEEIYVIGKGFVGTRDSGSVLRHPPVQSTAKNGRQHPNEKPISLIRDLMRKTAGRVLDPFMGSGSTGVAAMEMGREFTGIESDERYFDIACKRIEQAYAQGKLFEHEQTKQTQDALI